MTTWPLGDHLVALVALVALMAQVALVALEALNPQICQIQYMKNAESAQFTRSSSHYMLLWVVDFEPQNEWKQEGKA